MIRKNRMRTGVVFICCFVVLLTPVQAHAFFDLSFDILSFGPFSIGFSIPLRGALGLLAGVTLVGAVISFFSGGSGGSYSAAYAAPPPIRHVKVTVKPGDPYTGDALRARLLFKNVEMDENHRISLPGGKGFLQVDFESGKMIFKDVDFEGYVRYHNDYSLTVWDDRNQPVLVLKVDENEKRLLIVQEKSENAALALNLLLGRTS